MNKLALKVGEVLTLKHLHNEEKNVHITKAETGKYWVSQSVAGFETVKPQQWKVADILKLIEDYEPFLCLADAA